MWEEKFITLLGFSLSERWKTVGRVVIAQRGEANSLLCPEIKSYLMLWENKLTLYISRIRNWIGRWVFFLTPNPIRIGLSSDFRDKTYTFISYKARDFEPWFFWLSVCWNLVYLFELCGASPCIFRGEVQSRLPLQYVLAWLLVINICLLSSDRVKYSQSLS